MSDTVEAWDEAVGQTSSITVEQLDAALKAYNDKYSEYEVQKAKASALHKEAETLEKKLIEAMEQAGKSKYYCEGVGTAYFSDKMVVTTPKTNDDKRKLFDWLKEKNGETFFLATVSVNHQTLQSLYNSELQKAVDEGGDASTFHIPGLEQPTSKRSLNLRGERS